MLHVVGHRAASTSAAVAGGVVAIGNFDGLHRGHQALLSRARTRANERGARAGVLTFEPHPTHVLQPAMAPPLILTPVEKIAGLSELGMDVVVVEPFDATFAARSPESFVDDVLVGALRVGGVVVGPDFNFGRHAAGKTADLARLLAPHGVSLDVVDSVREGDLVCSSTKVRGFVLEGRMDAASLVLGRPYWIAGEVVRGDGRGRQLKVPTANVATARDLLPKVGVYATRARTPDGRVYESVTNVGLRPTFEGRGVRIEAHLLGFDGDLYGQRLHLDFIARLRDEQRFANVDALFAQIQADIATAKKVLAS
jgi:riboflavin kinase/FMN adenylyltransferase